MDWKLFLSTFGAIFLAEMGDKTQLATMGLASGPAGRLPVFLGAAAALIATTALAVIGGKALSTVIAPHWIQRAAGALFIVLGVVYLATARAPGP